jgi:hypothetical protein
LSIPEEDGAYGSTLSIAFDDATLILSTQAMVGYACLWLGSLLTTGVVGHWLASRRPG